MSTISLKNGTEDKTLQGKYNVNILKDTEPKLKTVKENKNDDIFKKTALKIRIVQEKDSVDTL